MFVYADGSYYSADCRVEYHGYQTHFFFTTKKKIEFQKGKSAISVKYGRASFDPAQLRLLSGLKQEFLPRIFLDGIEKVGK